MTNLPNNSQTGLEAAIARALEKRAEPAIPQDFAARVITALPPHRRRRSRTPVGRTIAIAAALALALTIFALAPHTTPNLTSFGFDMELLMLAQLGGIAYWFTRREV